MRFGLLLVLLTLFGGRGHAQNYTSSSVFAHNDYTQPIPFYSAYELEVGYIEADVFLRDGRLLVAHTQSEIDTKKTLDSLYLKPLVKQINAHSGFAYKDTKKSLTLMIDLKTEGLSTLHELVKLVSRYPKLLAAKNFEIVISGNVPEPIRWAEFPEFIHFDGRPGKKYTSEQLSRISLISTAFTEYSPWNGKGVLPVLELRKIQQIKAETQALGKKLRFWASPDFPNAWIQLMNLNIDVIGSDQVSQLITFMAEMPKNTYINKDFHQAYKPSYAHNRLAKPKNIILLIGDGTGLAQLFSGYTANQGALSLFQIKDIGFSLTSASDSYITDSAAGATAMATGVKTKNRFVGVDSLGNKLIPITDRFKEKKFRTAIISNGDITDATPASFYAHQPERSLSEAIALDFLNTKNDILIGGGLAAFTKRTDKRNLLAELSHKGYTISEKFSSLDAIEDDRFVVLDDSAVRSKKQGRGDFLSRSLNKSFSSFSKSKDPFFIMLEGAQIDWGGHNNDMEYVIREVLDFDLAIGEAVKFVDENKETILIITADHETGGLSLLDGNLKEGFVHGSFSTNDHTPIMVPVFSYGPGSGFFNGVYSNTEIFTKLMKLTDK